MKSIKIYSIILLATFIFIGCKKQTNLDLSGTYTIKPGQNLFIPKNINLATITVADFADSRCPINADCIWLGIGTVKIKLKDEVKEQNIELCIGACDVVSKPKTQDIILNNINYTVQLTELSPYPGTTASSNQTAKATIVIKKK